MASVETVRVDVDERLQRVVTWALISRAYGPGDTKHGAETLMVPYVELDKNLI
jgi:hypothetical protein